MRLLITCTKQLLLVDSERASAEVLEAHRPTYYGISWTEDGQELCLAHTGVEAESLDSMEAYMDSDIGSLSIGERRSEIAASAPHQILCVGDHVIVVNTGRNCLTLVDRRSFYYRHVWLNEKVRWDRKTIADRPGNHFNSVFLKGDRLYVMAHNWDRGSWIQVLSWPDLKPVERIATTALAAHNIWVTDDEEIIVCDTYRGSLVEVRSGRTLWANGVENFLTRGLACDGKHVFVGQVRAGGRSARAVSDSGVWILDRESWNLVDFLPLYRAGDVHEVRLVDVPDLCHHGQPYTGPLKVNDIATKQFQNATSNSLTGHPEWLDIRMSDASLKPAWREVFGHFEIFGSMASPLELAVAVEQQFSARDVSISAEVSVGPGGTQHAGVVARYRGPDERNMIVGLLSNNRPNGQAELWEQDGARWSRLGSAIVGQRGTITLKAVGKHLELLFDGQSVVQAEQSGEPLPGGVGVRALRGMISKCVVCNPAESLTTGFFQRMKSA